MSLITKAERDARSHIIQQRINNLEEEKNRLIIRLSALSDQGIIAVVQDEYFDVENKLDELTMQLMISNSTPTIDDVNNPTVNNVTNNTDEIVEMKVDSETDVDLHDWPEISVNEDEWIIRDPMDPYKDTFKVETDIVYALEVTNKVELKKMLQNKRVRIPTSLQNKQAWMHIVSLLQKKITIYSVDEQTLDEIGNETLPELAIYVYTTHDVYETTTNKSQFSICIKRNLLI
jgi:hypothetical protein